MELFAKLKTDDTLNNDNPKNSIKVAKTEKEAHEVSIVENNPVIPF